MVSPPESEPSKKSGKRSLASKKDASQEEKNETTKVQMQEANETKDDKDKDMENNVVKENQDENRMEGTILKRNPHILWKIKLKNMLIDPMMRKNLRLHVEIYKACNKKLVAKKLKVLSFLRTKMRIVLVQN